MGWTDPKKRGGKRARNKQRLESRVTRGAVALLGETEERKRKHVIIPNALINQKGALT